MKLSKRERRLLILLAFFTLWVLTFNYIIVPEYSRMNTYAMQLKRLESKREEIELTMAMKDSTAKTLEEQLSARAGEDFFYHNLDTVGADLLIQAVAKEAGLGLTAVSLQKEPVENEPGSGELVAGANKKDTSGAEELPFYEITVVLNVRGRMTDAMKFLDSIHESGRAMIVSEFELLEIHNTPEIKGDVTIVIYSLDEEDEEADDGQE